MVKIGASERYFFLFSCFILKLKTFEAKEHFEEAHYFFSENASFLQNKKKIEAIFQHF